MRSLPLFHRITGQKVIVLGEGQAAEAKCRLVERAGGEVVRDWFGDDVHGARLAFVAHDDGALCEADCARLRAAGLLVNVVDRPDLCDFTVPSLLDRDPVLVAIGTSGASAGLAKQLRLRLEGLLPAGLGDLAEGLSRARDAIKIKWPSAGDRRQALDRALSAGEVLDPLAEGAAGNVDLWLSGETGKARQGVVDIFLVSEDPEDLTLRQARLLGSADAVLFDPEVPAAILDRARADARRLRLPCDADGLSGLVVAVRLRRRD